MHIQILVDKRLGKPRHKQENDIKMDIKEIGCLIVDWVHLAQDRLQWRALVDTVINRQVPRKEENFLMI
jgi:hypothetical protein